MAASGGGYEEAGSHNRTRRQLGRARRRYEMAPEPLVNGGPVVRACSYAPSNSQIFLEDIQSAEIQSGDHCMTSSRVKAE
jgi:hypothetical protein